MTKTELTAQLDNRIADLERQLQLAKLSRHELSGLSDSLVSLLSNGQAPTPKKKSKGQLGIADAAYALFKQEPQAKTAAELADRIGRKVQSVYQTLCHDERFARTKDGGTATFSLKEQP